MFKKLRNSFLIMNCIIIGALIICCFGINYIMVCQGISRTIDRKLNNEIEMVERRIGNVSRQPDADFGSDSGGERGGRRPQGAPRGDLPPDGEHPLDLGRNQAFAPTFSLVTDLSGEVTEVNMAFAMTEDFYSERAAEIALAKKDAGRLRHTNSDGSQSIWEYKRKGTEDGYIIAFTEISSDLGTLHMLGICLLLIAAAATVMTVFISLFFANRSIKPIEEAYNKQKQFIADASHELKTPLTTINTNIDVLLSKSGSTIDEERKWLLYIKDETRRMSKLTNDLLYLARADYNAGNQVYGSVSWTDIVNNAILIMEARIFESQIALNAEVADGISVQASEERLKQIVMILLDNAVKYTPEGGAIDLRLFKRNSDACLVVRNTGAGISAEDLPHIFDRFYRSDKARTYTETSGYGLGLAIAKTAAESFKGSISAESDSESYAMFTVKIPIAKL